MLLVVLRKGDGLTETRSKSSASCLQSRQQNLYELRNPEKLYLHSAALFMIYTHHSIFLYED